MPMLTQRALLGKADQDRPNSQPQEERPSRSGLNQTTQDIEPKQVANIRLREAHQIRWNQTKDRSHRFATNHRGKTVRSAACPGWGLSSTTKHCRSHGSSNSCITGLLCDALQNLNCLMIRFTITSEKEKEKKTFQR